MTLVIKPLLRLFPEQNHLQGRVSGLTFRNILQNILLCFSIAIFDFEQVFVVSANALACSLLSRSRVLYSLKHEKHPGRSITFSTKSNTPPWVFFTFLKLYRWQSTQTVLFVGSTKWRSYEIPSAFPDSKRQMKVDLWWHELAGIN